jgi:hypothetical protein
MRLVVFRVRVHPLPAISRRLWWWVLDPVKVQLCIAGVGSAQDLQYLFLTFGIKSLEILKHIDHGVQITVVIFCGWTDLQRDLRTKQSLLLFWFLLPPLRRLFPDSRRLTFLLYARKLTGDITMTSILLQPLSGTS